MKKVVAIVGAGRVGLACAKIIRHLNVADVVLVDERREALDGSGFDARVAIGEEALYSTLVDINPAVVICSTPFFINKQVAKAAHRLKYDYIDFTEDNEVTRFIESLDVTDCTFVPQTGLAPGLVNYLGLSLFSGLGQPKKLSLRVGALPHTSFGPEHYAVTWSPEGLVNEYFKMADRKVNGIIEQVAPLTEEETLIVDGVCYEGFTTSGGVGSLAAYDHIPTVEYKTLRYPGHLHFIQKLFAQGDFDQCLALAKKTFITTRNDVVVLAVQAVDMSNHSASRGIHFYPHDELGLTALELTTSGVGVAVVELLLTNALPTGVLRPDQVPFELLRTTRAYSLIFDAAR